MTPPLEEYARRQRARETDVAARERVHVWLGNAKVAIFIGILIYWAVTLDGDPSPWFYGVAIAAFIALSAWHEVVLRAMARATAAVAFYRAGAARIQDDWMTAEPTGERFKSADHRYADDLDVFGARSLFQLLSLCRTPMGEERLASWLLAPPAIDVIRQRQSRVAALRAHLDLRERVAVVNAGQRRFMLPDRLVQWAEQPASLPALRPLIVGLALLFVAAFAWFMNGGRGWPALAALAINGATIGILVKRANAIVEGLSASTGATSLDLLSNVITQIEHEPFTEPALAALAHRLKGGDGHVAASMGIRRLARVSDWADSRHNVFSRLSEIPFLFTLQVAYACESWRRRHGHQFRDWVDAVGEMEALLSLAGYSYEHPADPFPELIESATPLLEAVAIAHPLIPSATAVPNTVVLGGEGRPRVLIVSGSNMSGKSTLLRTVGVSVVMAQMGAPVRATSLRLSPLRVGATLRVQDSLQQGRSRFYAEIMRVRELADIARADVPLLFLLDELFHGTNSHDRLAGATGVLRDLIAHGAIGLVTTHDMALAAMADSLGDAAVNVHFEDWFEGGEMRFDYRMKPGPVTRSNALALMRAVGLDIRA